MIKEHTGEYNGIRLCPDNYTWVYEKGDSYIMPLIFKKGEYACNGFIQLYNEPPNIIVPSIDETYYHIGYFDIENGQFFHVGIHNQPDAFFHRSSNAPAKILKSGVHFDAYRLFIEKKRAPFEVCYRKVGDLYYLGYANHKRKTFETIYY